MCHDQHAPATPSCHHQPSRRRLGAVTLTCLALGLLGAGCEPYEPTCGEAPAVPIHGFEVTTVTGENATDMDIHFCFLRKSAADVECYELDTSADNFEEWQTDSFQLGVEPIAPGDLELFLVRNVGGGWFESSWDMHSVTVTALLEGGGRALLYDGTDIDVNIEKGESVPLDECAY